MRWLESRAAFFLLPIAITVLLILAVVWVSHRFSLEGRLQDRFGGIVMAVPPEVVGSYGDGPPAEISKWICPLVDAGLRAELEPRTKVEVGISCSTADCS